MDHSTDFRLMPKAAAAILTVFLTTACGGGGGGGASPVAPVSSVAGASPVPITTSGVITGFSSVFVNGVRYDTSSAEVEFEDEGRVDEDALRLGMRVRIEGSRDGGSRRADRIHYDRDLKGPVSAISPASADPGIGTFTLLQQTVTVDANTVFDNDVGDVNQDGSINLLDLNPTPARIVVEVSGFPTAEGFLATRVDRVGAGAAGQSSDEVEVKGFTSNLDETAGTFSIRGLVVIYESADLDSEDFPNGRLSANVFLEVKGTLLTDGSVEATRIELEDNFDDDGDREGEFEIEGVLQSVNVSSNPNTITINGITLSLQDASRLVGLEGMRIELKGSFNDAGELVLRSNDDGVKSEAENSVRIEDRVDTVGASSFTTRLGIVVNPTGSSRVEDDDSDDGDRLTPTAFLSRLSNGDFIEARGVPNSDGSVNWTRIERDEEDDLDCRLRGPVDAGSISNPTFAILGVTVDTSGISSSGGFEDRNGTELGRDAFFAQLSAGDIVQAQSVENGSGCSDGLLIAREVEFEDEDGVFGTGPSNPGVDEVSGIVSNVDDVNSTFEVGGRSVIITADTLIDASIVEASRGVELPAADLRFGDLPESLGDLLSNGMTVSVRLDGSGNAVLIED